MISSIPESTLSAQLYREGFLGKLYILIKILDLVSGTPRFKWNTWAPKFLSLLSHCFDVNVDLNTQKTLMTQVVHSRDTVTEV